ncbi:circularly permuted type 2 ATP-grasp protein [Granulicoccus phenolivorans]|uniref:circularly permuted type 2 ATP-grasp protein n=1 Tax=Granulicoccus phenolivorans TaxID=266854 RepID=UPI000688AB1E|nr:circularly permuted type 2 ATP-grasp protein [Granulicoccus phenolivorans]
MALFADYPRLAAWDEMLAGDGRTRSQYQPIRDTLNRMGGELEHRADALARSYLDQGVTFDYAGEERAFPLDLVPRIITADEWDVIESGVAQRVKALEAFLADVYGREGSSLPRVVEAGLLPARIIRNSPHFHRAVAGIHPHNEVRCHVSGIDLIRDAEGVFRVLEDNVRVPSGVSYVISNRRAMTNVLPEIFENQHVRPVHDYPRTLLEALRAAAPDGNPDPTVVVLTPGVHNSAYFEHALLARLMGVELVEGRDLVCTGGAVRMKTTDGEQQVDVIYRRIDDEFLDPVQFRPDSLLGCPGLVDSQRAGKVAIANAIGNGVADDKLVYSYVPDFIRFYLEEDPILPNVDTYRCVEPAARDHVLAHLDEMVVKPVDGSGGKGLVMGPKASGATLDALREKLLADPRGWIAQPVVQLSTVPTLINGEFRPRHVDLRPFAVNDGSNVTVLPGGLTRVALPEGQLVVNSSQGGGSKDTWVLAPETDAEETDEPGLPSAEIIVMTPPEMADEDDWQDQQEQQQQQTQQTHQGPGAGAC